MPCKTFPMNPRDAYREQPSWWPQSQWQEEEMQTARPWLRLWRPKPWNHWLQLQPQDLSWRLESSFKNNEIEWKWMSACNETKGKKEAAVRHGQRHNQPLARISVIFLRSSHTPSFQNVGEWRKRSAHNGNDFSAALPSISTRIHVPVHIPSGKASDRPTGCKGNAHACFLTS